MSAVPIVCSNNYFPIACKGEDVHGSLSIVLRVVQWVMVLSTSTAANIGIVEPSTQYSKKQSNRGDGMDLAHDDADADDNHNSKPFVRPSAR